MYQPISFQLYEARMEVLKGESLFIVNCERDQNNFWMDRCSHPMDRIMNFWHIIK